MSTRNTVPPEPRWVAEYRKGIEYVENRNGVGWFDAPKPPRRHRCETQTRAYMSGSYVERCACGAIRLGGSAWQEKNGERGNVQLRPSYYRSMVRLWRRVALVCVLVAPIAGVLWIGFGIGMPATNFVFGLATGGAVGSAFNIWRNSRKARWAS